ncbi:hypothetical protein [Nocardia sp. XZ_19_369]|uniref:hypothetical protein n=1 Tax=Nocardia sp. XZ_19_369 TaxID=2769487 RepID=UPI0018906418|nr:hypothetical protein [Nocardia sp. XZ_19_369]
MATADDEARARRHDPHTFEVLGRVAALLFDTPGPLAECLSPRLYPTLTGSGYVLSWHGVAPTVDDVADYLSTAAADDEMTTVLRPGDVRFKPGHYCTVAEVRGVQFHLRPDPVIRPDAYAAMGEYWRTGKLPFPAAAARQ